MNTGPEVAELARVRSDFWRLRRRQLATTVTDAPIQTELPSLLPHTLAPSLTLRVTFYFPRQRTGDSSAENVCRNRRHNREPSDSHPHWIRPRPGEYSDEDVSDIKRTRTS